MPDGSWRRGFGTPGEEALLWEVYPAIPKISVDYGIMERADHVLHADRRFRLERRGRLGRF